MRQFFQTVFSFISGFKVSTTHQLRVFTVSSVFFGVALVFGGVFTALFFTPLVWLLHECSHTYMNRECVSVFGRDFNIPKITPFEDMRWRGAGGKIRRPDFDNFKYCLAGVVSSIIVLVMFFLTFNIF